MAAKGDLVQKPAVPPPAVSLRAPNMTFTLSPAPPTEGGRQAVQMLRRELESRGLDGALKPRGPSGGVRLMSYMWHIAYVCNGMQTKLLFGDRTILFRLVDGERVEVWIDGSLISFTREGLWDELCEL